MKKPITAPWPRLRRLVQDIGTLLLFAAVITAIAVGFPRPAAQAPGPGSEGDSNNRPGGGVAVQTQVLEIWMPEPLADLGKGEPPFVRRKITRNSNSFSSARGIKTSGTRTPFACFRSTAGRRRFCLFAILTTSP